MNRVLGATAHPARPAPAIPYPTGSSGRSRWILERRGARHPVNAFVPYHFLAERELAASGEAVDTATVFLTNRECPWRCLMCDLWKNTLTENTPAGAIPAQIKHALERLPPARQIKLYNSGSFFDPKAIPPDDYERIAETLEQFDRVIVESHPALIRPPVAVFQALLRGRLEVAMGLETVHPGALERLNKGMTLDDFRRAADFLAAHGIDLRVFVLLKPPFMPDGEELHWARQSIDFAFECGAGVVSIIPTRTGNGSLEELAAAGLFSRPKLSMLEAAVAYGAGLQRGRVFADTWNLEEFDADGMPLAIRRQHLEYLNSHQRLDFNVDQ